MADTIRFNRRHLPHWEIEDGRYFVTVRCADSLPREATLRLDELSQNLRRPTPRSPEFAKFQRQTFHTLEKYLDARHGACPLKRADIAKVVIGEFAQLAEWRVQVPHFTLMPNHWQAMGTARHGNANGSTAGCATMPNGRSALPTSGTIR